MGDPENDKDIMDPKNKKLNGPGNGWSGETTILYHKGAKNRIPWPHHTRREVRVTETDHGGKDRGETRNRP